MPVRSVDIMEKSDHSPADGCRDWARVNRAPYEMVF